MGLNSSASSSGSYAEEDEARKDMPEDMAGETGAESPVMDDVEERKDDTDARCVLRVGDAFCSVWSCLRNVRPLTALNCIV